MARRYLVFSALLLAGCGTSTTEKPVAAPKKTASVTSLQGSGSRIDLGGTLEEAKAAFPAPKGAQVFNQSMSFAILQTDGWSWASEKPPDGFEAAAKGGKIVGLARTRGDSSSEPGATIADIGESVRKFEGKTASSFVWESGQNARFLIVVKKPLPLMPFGSLTVIGSKEDLKLLNYRADDPATIVRQLDAAQEQMNSPEMKKIFEQAKERAKAKAGK